MLQATQKLLSLLKGETPLRIAFAADLHLYPSALTGDYNQAFKTDNYDLGKPAEQSEGVLVSALAALKVRARHGKLDYLILAGDLTRNGEYDAHERLARRLRRFQKKSGVKVIVIPGNHDLNNSGAADYRSGSKQPGRKTSPAEFLSLYRHLGYELPNCNRWDADGTRGMDGMCSYAVDLGRKYRLIAIDTSKYHDGEAQVGGNISAAQLDWIVNECKTARAAGKTIIGLGHHNLAEHVGYQGAVFGDYLLDDYLRVREILADAGMQFYFSGHIHVADIAKVVSDSGSLLYDICVPALYAFPGELMDVTLTRKGTRSVCEVKTFAADEALAVTAAGRTYAQPYYKENFHLTFGGSQGGGLTGFMLANVRLRVTPLLEEIQHAGGLMAWLKQNGTEFGRTTDTLLSALFAQLDSRYINDPAHTVELLSSFVKDAMAQPISEVPCTRFLDTLGIGDPARPGNVQDFLETGLAMVYGGMDSKTTDPFLRDVRRRMKDSRFIDQVLRYAIDKIVDDLLDKGLSPQLKLLLGPKPRRDGIKNALRAAAGIVIDLKRRRIISQTLDWLMGEFFFSGRVREGTLVHKGRVPVPVKVREGDFRCPMELRVKQEKSAVTLHWYTKESVTASDVLVLDDDLRPVKGLQISAETTPVRYRAQKLDLGFMKLMGQEIGALRHDVTVTGLPPGRYHLLAGDNARGWMSEGVTVITGKHKLTRRVFRYIKATASAATRVFFSFRLLE